MSFAVDFMNAYNAHKAKVEAEAKIQPVEKPRRFVEIPKKERKLVRYEENIDLSKFSFPEPKKALKSNYAVIDHVGSLDEKDFEFAYSTIAARAYKHGYTYKKKSLISIKKLCVASYNPFAKQPICWKDKTGKLVYDEEKIASMKFAMRYQKSPKQVYFICYELDKNTEREVKKWAERGIPVEVHELMTHQHFAYKDFAYSHQFYTETRFPRQREWAETWAPAFGDSFIAPEPYRLLKDRQTSVILPITRLNSENELDVYALGNREQRKELQNRNVKVSKVTSTAEKFLEQTRCIVPDADINHYAIEKYQFKRFIDMHPHTTDSKIYWTSEGMDFEDMLEIDRVICPHCGKPMNPHNHRDANQRLTEFIICTNCETQFDEDTFGGAYPVCEPYFEDSSDEFDRWLDDITESEDSYYAEDFDCE